MGEAAVGVDLLVIATPDDEVARVAASVTPVDSTVVIHLSGSLGLDVLAGHPRRGSLHPLMPLPTPAVGAERLRSGITFAVAGDPMAAAVAVASLGGRPASVDDPDRASYHAAASIAANHLVALIGQVERVAASAGLPLDAFAGPDASRPDDALALGPRRALTGPAARGDWDTVDRHRTALAGWPATGPSSPPTTPWSAWPGGSRSTPSRPRRRRPVTSPPRPSTSWPRTWWPGSRWHEHRHHRGAHGHGRRPGPAPAHAAVAVHRDGRRVLAALDAVRRAGETVGVVPTMGALHEGHRSLIERAAARVRRGGGVHLRQPDPVR